MERVGLFYSQPGDQVLAQADLVITVGYDSVEYESKYWSVGRPKRIIRLDTTPAGWDAAYEPDIELFGGFLFSGLELQTAVRCRIRLTFSTRPLRASSLTMTACLVGASEHSERRSTHKR